jgi:Arc/MetJ-type ribon-helix-helix transcriptional regulator
MYYHTMSKSKIAITVESEVLKGLDALVRAGRYANRSRAFEAAAAAELDRAHHTRLAKACLALDPAEERAMAEEGLSADAASWPAY